ncbi:Rrf2-like transcriptional regulator protein [uncultured Alphaproteobacteria bacterium]|uniref:Rrf2-like transcriptional regulator protein n=1 Tax=uncultured Alphaproteobacteria bacterium TaxID=91750 RepID=A0A212JJD5_9PROT|nr:Rrf2-like transcriptional regulator protein [uncultured Alphaproteobacteria bacterium]
MARNCRFTAAVHVCAVLASHPDEDVTSDYVAASLNTNPVVVRRLLSALGAAGLAHAKRGSAGGYRLARAAAEIDLAEIAAAVDDDDGPAFAPNPPNPACIVGRGIKPALAGFLARAEAAKRAELARVSLAEVMARVFAVV